MVNNVIENINNTISIEIEADIPAQNGFWHIMQ